MHTVGRSSMGALSGRCAAKSCPVVSLPSGPRTGFGALPAGPSRLRCTPPTQRLIVSKTNVMNAQPGAGRRAVRASWRRRTVLDDPCIEPADEAACACVKALETRYDRNATFASRWRSAVTTLAPGRPPELGHAGPCAVMSASGSDRVCDAPRQHLQLASQPRLSGIVPGPSDDPAPRRRGASRTARPHKPSWDSEWPSPQPTVSASLLAGALRGAFRASSGADCRCLTFRGGDYAVRRLKMICLAAFTPREGAT